MDQGKLYLGDRKCEKQREEKSSSGAELCSLLFTVMRLWVYFLKQE